MSWFSTQWSSFIDNSSDMAERKLAEEAYYANLQYRINFEQLLTTLSTRFINCAYEYFDFEINYALQAIGWFTEVDRIYVFMFSPDGMTVSNTHEWCNEGISMQIQNMQVVPVHEISWVMSKIKER